MDIAPWCYKFGWIEHLRMLNSNKCEEFDTADTELTPREGSASKKQKM